MKIARCAKPPLAMQALQLLRRRQATPADQDRIRAVQHVILTGMVDDKLAQRHQPQFRYERSQPEWLK